MRKEPREAGVHALHMKEREKKECNYSDIKKEMTRSLEMYC